jgi:AcrR family transcriptional regulator
MSADIRETLLSAATETFARFGYKKTSIDDIARRAGIGKGTVYLHFESKEELFGAVVRRLWTNALAEIEAGVKQARTPQKKVRAFLEGRQRQHLSLSTTLNISPDALLELLAAAQPHRRDARAREAALLEEIIRDGNAQGVFAVRSPRLVAAGATACIQGVDAFLVGPAAVELLAQLAELDEIFVRGLLAAARLTRPSE